MGTERTTLFGNLFLGVGAMKAGTTWLYRVLAHHLELHFTPEKELHYFYHRYVDPNFLNDTRRAELCKAHLVDTIAPGTAIIDKMRLNLHWMANYLGRPLDDFWYRNLFSFQRWETYGCDFSNLHALLPASAWKTISGDCNKLRVLYTLRHPVDRLWSHAKFQLQVTGQLDRLDAWGPRQFDRFIRQDFLWQHTEYGANLRQMKAGLDPEQLRVQFYEDLHEDQLGTLYQIQDFLEIARHAPPKHVMDQRFNPSLDRSMPDFFPGLIQRDVARIVKELEVEGLRVPASWRI